MHNGRYLSTKQLCITAIMGAFVFLFTVLPKIPIPLGYAHLGDAAIFLVVYYAGRMEGIIAGCIGSALADLIGGFPIWVIPTLFIKFIMAESFWRIMPHKKDTSLRSPQMAGALIISCIVMAIGYTLFGSLLYGSLAVGLTSIPGLLMEGAVNIVLFYIAAGALNNTGLKKKI